MRTTWLYVIVFYFLKLHSSEMQILFSTKDSYVVYNESIKNSVLNHELYTWLQDCNPEKIKEVMISCNQDCLKVVSQFPESNYAYSQKKILYTQEISQCVGVGIMSKKNNYLFHFNFWFKENIQERMQQLEDVLKDLTQNKIIFKIALTSLCYSFNVFKILALIKKCDCTVHYYDIEPVFRSNPQMRSQKMKFPRKIFFYLFDPSFDVENTTFIEGKKLVLFPCGSIYNADIEEVFVRSKTCNAIIREKIKRCFSFLIYLCTSKICGSQ